MFAACVCTCLDGESQRLSEETHTHTQISCVFNQVPSHYHDRKTDLGLDCEKLAQSGDLKELAAWKSVFLLQVCICGADKNHVKGNARCVRGWFGLQAPRKIERMWIWHLRKCQTDFPKTMDSVCLKPLVLGLIGESFFIYLTIETCNWGGYGSSTTTLLKLQKSLCPKAQTASRWPTILWGARAPKACQLLQHLPSQINSLLSFSRHSFKQPPQHTVLPLFPRGCCRRRCVAGVSSCSKR